ncbi:MAG: hypothetical protein IKL18_06325 [Oscillospiraceae bacterium]|nr:hypothetical protein [Oscillospiraceae bacterium]
MGFDQRLFYLLETGQKNPLKTTTKGFFMGGICCFLTKGQSFFAFRKNLRKGEKGNIIQA